MTFRIICSVDHTETGGAKPGAVIGVHEDRLAAERRRLELSDSYSACDFKIEEDAK